MFIDFGQVIFAMARSLFRMDVGSALGLKYIEMLLVTIIIVGLALHMLLQ